MTASLDEFVAGISVVVQRMPAGHVRVFASAVGQAPGHDEAVGAGVLSAMANPVYRQHAEQLLACWRKMPTVSGGAFGLAVLSALAMREAERDAESVEAVATGPSSPHLSLRPSKAVLLDLVCHASAQLLVVSFAAYKVPEIVKAIGDAARRGVVVRMVLETAEDSAGALSHDGAKAFADVAGGLEFYIWPSDRRPAGVQATLHAKAVVADACAAFVTSANLTGSALDYNLELGVLVRGGPVPKRLADHFSSLIGAGVLRRA